MTAPEVATLLRDLYDDDYVWFNFRDAFNNYICVRLSQGQVNSYHQALGSFVKEGS